MKKSTITVEEVKNKILNLKGKEIKMEINRGRNKIIQFEGQVVSVYPSVFTVKNINETSKCFIN